MNFKSIFELYDYLPEDERILVDVLRQIVSKNLPEYCKEKLSFSVPYFHGKRGICIIWPASVKGGGVKQGVLLGFIHGNKLNDIDHYLNKGTNKKIFYKIYLSPEQIEESAIATLLTEAVRVDKL
jgi:hypothetical protein